jgi:hypothetical protein
MKQGNKLQRTVIGCGWSVIATEIQNMVYDLLRKLSEF